MQISINAAFHPTQAVRTKAFACKISSSLIIAAPGGLIDDNIMVAPEIGLRPCPTPDRHLRRAGRKALEGACRVHLRVQRRTPRKEAGGRGRFPPYPGVCFCAVILPQSSRGYGRRLNPMADGKLWLSI